MEWRLTMVTAYVPLASISPFNSLRTGLLTIVLKVYCDGSGHPNDPNAHYLVLAGLIAPPEAWDRFEREWRTTLDLHGSPPWHSKDAYRRTGDFEGWTLDRVKALRNDLYTRCFDKIAWEESIIHANCTVVLEDYRRAKAKMPDVGSTPPEVLCTYWIANTATAWLAKNTDDPSGKEGLLELYFDQNEPFQNHIQKAWEQRKRDSSDIISRIVMIGAVDYREVLPIQAADFMAWHTNRGRRRPDTDQIADIMSSFGAPRASMFWDYDRLIAAYTEKLAGGASG
jgi:hypothetical protein